jgi:hypothetical protein
MISRPGPGNRPVTQVKSDIAILTSPHRGEVIFLAASKQDLQNNPMHSSRGQFFQWLARPARWLARIRNAI